MRTRQVTRAAQHLGVGQPAMSAALSRLRVLFADPLLVRRGNEMMPTKRALKLASQVRDILRDIDAMVALAGPFDPASSNHEFRLRMSDLMSFLLLPDLVSRLEQTSRDLRLNVVHLAPEATCDALTRDEVDVAVSTGLKTTASIREQRLFGDSIVCIARRDLALSTRLGSVEAFARAPQVRVSQSPLDLRFADAQLQALGVQRNIAVTVPHWLAVPEILCASSLLAVVPASLAVRMAEKQPLQICPLQFLETEFDWGLYWHRRYDNDDAKVWFRRELVTLCEHVMAGSGARM